MSSVRARLASGSALLILSLSATLPALAQEAGDDAEVINLDAIVISAEDQIKQALGVSQVTEADLRKLPVVNDIAEIVRKQPGVNLTGNSASGQRGNQRQIDIRGMGPENVLILIDGKPVTSRNTVRMGRQGERNTRGDSQWVPPELVERIEVIRGPAAARYGSGAAGGVINIVTKKPDTRTASFGLHFNLPESEDEGATRRANLMFAGPLGERLSYRVWANYNDTEESAPDLNDDGTGTVTSGGIEGSTNKDVGALLRWEIDAENTLDLDLAYSRQGNVFVGEDGHGGTPDLSSPLIGEETNRTKRTTVALTHSGAYAWGELNSYVQWEHTDDSRVCEGSSGGGEGDLRYCVDTDGDGTNDAFEWRDTIYDSVTAKSELDLYGSVLGRQATWTLGAEYRGEWIDDDGREFTTSASREQHLFGVFAEGNIQATDKLTVTPGLRYDHSSSFDSNLSPSLNATYAFDGQWTAKVGLARAFKAPNLYQLNPDYYYNTRGRGCPAGFSGPCRIRGNADLEPEYSFNKEIGIAYDGFNGVNASLTYFHNDYKNRIASDVINGSVDPATGGSVFEWTNTPEAVVSGLEGNFYTPLSDQFAFNMNFTYMLESENKQTGNPLSLVPDYTINAALDWQAREDVLVTLSATHYGEIPTVTRTLSTNDPITDPVALTTRDPYTLVNLNVRWDVNERASLVGGVTNIFDTRIERTNNGSETFNEPGRAFYVGLNATF